MVGSKQNVSFIGPFRGTHAFPTPEESVPEPPYLPGEEAPNPSTASGRYASGVSEGFVESGHASWWGRQASETKNTIRQWVRDHQPDYLLLLLGFNDLGWFVSGPEALHYDIKQIIDRARDSKPNVKILVGNVVHRTFLNGRQDLVDSTNRYNIMLHDSMQDWTTDESPVVLVDLNTAYDCEPHSGCGDAYDGLHPVS